MAKDEAYLEAERKIEEARRLGARELDLSQKFDAEASEKLTELPDSLWELTFLQSLDLSGNQLASLPESIGHLTALKSLNLSSNLLSSLPETIGRITNLQLLNVSRNSLTRLPEFIGQLKVLRSLKVSANELSVLTDSIGDLSVLEELDLTMNNLTKLPSTIGHLIELEALYLMDNKLMELPISIGNLLKLQTLGLSRNSSLSSLPKSLGNLHQLRQLGLAGNSIDPLPEFLGQLINLRLLGLASSGISSIPHWLRNCTKLKNLHLGTTELIGNWGFHLSPKNKISLLPSWLGELKNLSSLGLDRNQLTDLPPSLGQLQFLAELNLDKNPLNPELAAAYEQGLDAVKAYLRAKAEDGEIILNEAKLILVGEGAVGKTSLLAALRRDPFVEERETTHGIEVDIKSLQVKDPKEGTEITLNGWDFGGQNIYRHTHQLFFTAPAIYLAVWEPRRGPEQCRVSEWIKMIKHRAYDESRPEERPRILVVATHGGPKERLGHIDEQALRDEFGDLIAGFHHVDSRPDEKGVYYGLDDLIKAIGREAAAIPSVGRTVPLSWKKVLEAIRQRSEKTPYLHYKAFEELCKKQNVSSELAATYAIILNELGHLINYRNDESLKDTVILKADYLSKAVSFVLEDKVTKEARGLVQHQRLGTLWNNPDRPEEERYPLPLHPVFLRLMTKFDLSYQVVMAQAEAPPTSLMAQLVPSQRSEGWEQDWSLKDGDLERTQVCRVLDAVTGRTVEAEGLMYRLIVRLHRYSLGRDNYDHSRHWKTGMLLDDGYNGRAFIEEIGGDVYVTVRAAYPERFLHQLCSEVQWLVEHFWKGLDARLYLPCPGVNCKGLLEIDEIMDYKASGASEVRCSVCRKFHRIDPLMATGQSKPALNTALAELRKGQQQILEGQKRGFGEVRTELRTLMSQADEQYANLLAWLSDPAKEGPRLFSFEPVNRSKFNPRSWTSEKFRLTLWCEHAQQPLPLLEGADPKEGVIEVELTRKWFKKAAPVLKVLTGTLSLILPVAASGLKLTMDETAYKAIEDQLDFGQEIIDASLDGGEKTIDWLEGGDETKLDGGIKVRAEGSVLHELHAILKAKDPDFGGLKRVQNKRREFLWVHERFVEKY